MNSLSKIMAKTRPITGDAIYTSRYNVRAYKKADKLFKDMMEKWVYMTYYAASVAIFENHPPKANGIKKLANIIPEIIAECDANKDLSVCEMCENETGYTLTNRYGKPWNEVVYLNSKLDLGKMTAAKMIQYRQKAVEWCPTDAMAIILIACHRLWGWSEVLQTIVSETIQVIDWCYNEKNRASELFQKVTGIEPIEDRWK